MDTKLTLKLEQQVIENAKIYAKMNHISLSKLIENYLNSLISDKRNDEDQISDFVKSMSTRTKLPADFDAKKERLTHLEKKYK